MPFRKGRPRQKGCTVSDTDHCALERPVKAGLKSLPSLRQPQCHHCAPGRAGNELAFSITWLMSSSFLKLHTSETANVIFFFPFLRKQPNPNPIMFAQPKGTSPLARQSRNAQMLCKSKRQPSSALPLTPIQTCLKLKPNLCALLAQAVTGTVLYPAPATPGLQPGLAAHEAQKPLEAPDTQLCQAQTLLQLHEDIYNFTHHPQAQTWPRAHPNEQFGVRAAATSPKGCEWWDGSKG